MKPIPSKNPEADQRLRRLKKLNREYDEINKDQTIPLHLKVNKLAILKKEISRVEKEYRDIVKVNESVDNSEAQ
jgi:hypothetical protein